MTRKSEVNITHTFPETDVLSLWSSISGHLLFRDLREDAIHKLLPYFRFISLQPGKILIDEGDNTSNELFIILKGNFDVVKKAYLDDADKEVLDNKRHFTVAKLGPGDLIGELSFLKGRPRAATIKCITRGELLALDPKKMEQAKITDPEAYGAIMKNLSGYVAGRLELTTSNEARALKTELQNSILKAKSNLFFSYVIGLLCIYNLMVGKIAQLSLDTDKVSMISALIILAFAMGLIFMIRQNKLPIHVMGLTLRNWKPAVIESLVWSLTIIALMVGVKWLLINSLPQYSNLPLIDFDVSSRSFVFNFLLYTLHSPIQEFVARGVLQGSLQHFFSGKNVALRAIIVSNALFSATHVHLLNGLLGVIVFVPGLFWGWLYSRHNSLVGVSVSHLLIGWTGLFFLNIESLF
jgi:CRP-like cAMP-binding protein/membrane protease YdiL (CAAX protease family)